MRAQGFGPREEAALSYHTAPELDLRTLLHAMGRLAEAMAMAQDDSDYYRMVSGIALRILPDRPDVLMLEIKTQHGPFRFGMSQDIAEKVAGQIGDHAERLRTRSARSLDDE